MCQKYTRNSLQWQRCRDSICDDKLTQVPAVRPAEPPWRFPAGAVGPEAIVRQKMESEYVGKSLRATAPDVEVEFAVPEAYSEAEGCPEATAGDPDTGEPVAFPVGWEEAAGPMESGDFSPACAVEVIHNGYLKASWSSMTSLSESLSSRIISGAALSFCARHARQRKVR